MISLIGCQGCFYKTIYLSISKSNHLMISEHKYSVSCTNDDWRWVGQCSEAWFS